MLRERDEVERVPRAVVHPSTMPSIHLPACTSLYRDRSLYSSNAASVVVIGAFDLSLVVVVSVPRSVVDSLPRNGELWLRKRCDCACTGCAMRDAELCGLRPAKPDVSVSKPDDWVSRGVSGAPWMKS